MKTTIKRFLSFFVGVPLAGGIVLLLPQKNQLAVNILIVLLSALGALEFANLLRKKNIPLSAPEAAVLGASCPLAATLTVSFGVYNEIILVIFVLGAFWLFLSGIFARKESFGDFAGRLAAGFAVMIYPGFFMIWIIKMALFSRANMIILMFLLITIANDSAAWAAGMLFGAGNRGIIPASPNKSVAGFAGGAAASILTGMGAVIFIPAVFSVSRGSSLPAGALLGFLSGLAGSLGDLGESVIKRSSQVKDSGNLIPGRGGILDSLDSIAFAAPIYYFSFLLLFA